MKKVGLVKKIKCLSVVTVATLVLAVFAGCGSSDTEKTDAPKKKDSSSNPITVVSREDGSGTRGAFVELFGVEEKDDAGNKTDRTTDDASIVSSTSVVMTTVAGDPNAIGYISLGSLNDTVKAIAINDVKPSVETIKDGTYEIARPFNIATKDDVSETAKDFISYILSTEGQKIVEENGYIPMDNTKPYEATELTGKIVVAGSSSVTPVMEKLKEAYEGVNSNVTIELQESDSTTGMTSVAEGSCDIGMASRELKDSETSQGITPTVIAMDGIAVIVNNESSVESLTKDEVKSIYVGEKKNWD